MIHYHGTPCGGKRGGVAEFLKGRHALVPWVRPEDIGTVAEVCQSFCLDNGAFTAWKSGNPIKDWSGYYEWVKLWMKHPGYDFAIIPDVIDGSEQDNNRLLTECENAIGYKWNQLAPVWHLHESLERLGRLVMRYQRVCIGSSGKWRTPGTESWWDRIAEAMAVACDKDGRPWCKLHGLRMLNPAIFHRLPLASADSTNAVRNGNSVNRYGMYTPPTLPARQHVNALRAEAHNSAAIWIPRKEQTCLIFSLKDEP